MIERDSETMLKKLARFYPVLSVTGPRQSGKTTLSRATFPDLPYVTLEPLDTREFATADPRGFLASLPDGAVIDEVQRVPALFSYLQAEVDERPTPGRFILTGSQNLALTASVMQSLAGRTGMLELYPPSWSELKRFGSAPTDLFDVLWTGSYPRIFDRNIPPRQWLADYVATYVQRDVRQLLNVSDLRAFTDFLRLAAGSTANEMHLSRLCADAGVSRNTAKAWLCVLESSYLIFRLPGWKSNLRKQVVKSAKLHFLDSGIVCYLLGIREPEQLRTHPLRGAVFESWIAAELPKQAAHSDVSPGMFHYRDSTGLEVDLVSGNPRALILTDAKFGATVASDFTTSLDRLASALLLRDSSLGMTKRVVYGGTMSQSRADTAFIPWQHIDAHWCHDAAMNPKSRTMPT